MESEERKKKSDFSRKCRVFTEIVLEMFLGDVFQVFFRLEVFQSVGERYES